MNDATSTEPPEALADLSGPPPARLASSRPPVVPVVVAVCLLAAFAFAAYRVVDRIDTTRAAHRTFAAASRSAAAVPHVRYAVSGTAEQASLVVVTPAGPEQLHNVQVPLATTTGTPYLEFVMKHGDPAGLEVRADDGGSVTCSISVGGTALVSKSVGPGQTAVCETTVP